MQRELNPQLFGSSNLTLESSSSPGRSASAERSADIKGLEAHLHSLKLNLQALERRLDSLTHQLQDFSKTTTGRFERMSQAMVRLEENASLVSKEASARMAGLTSKVNERKLNDEKVYEMVDRHNSLVRNFENRMTHMQRVISEQEMLLMNAQASLDEARKEIARLKKI